MAKRFAARVFLPTVALLLLLCPLSAQAGHTNERADPSVWIAPGSATGPEDNGYVYKEDPCVEALRLAMELMEPYLPHVLQAPLHDLRDRDYLQARRVWEDVKLQCWRH